jgi:hypothetical protein
LIEFVGELEIERERERNVKVGLIQAREEQMPEALLLLPSAAATEEEPQTSTRRGLVRLFIQGQRMSLDLWSDYRSEIKSECDQ